MAIRYTIETFGSSFPTKVAASAGSPHIYNITLSADTANGKIVGRGAWQELDRYAEAAAPDFELTVRGQATNGNWYVEVTAVDDEEDVIYIHNPAVIAEDYNRKFAAEKNFYIPAGKVGKGYTLIRGDIMEYSPERFDITPAVGDTITAINSTTGKLTVTHNG